MLFFLIAQEYARYNEKQSANDTILSYSIERISPFFLWENKDFIMTTYFFWESLNTQSA